MTKTLIIGSGEVGQGLFETFKRVHETYIRDVAEQPVPPGIEILHIAFPDGLSFVGHVRGYIEQYQPSLTIIHSSVRPGTTDLCGKRVVYSPVRGRHPNLAKEMRVFKKFVGGEDIGDVDRACAFFEACNWPAVAYDSARELETLKLLSNIHMGLEIAWRQEVERLVPDREIYQLWEDDYFHGYFKLGQHNLIRPRMRPDAIGGHCILECVKLLGQSHASKAFDFILESNEKVLKEAHHEARNQDAVA